MILFSTQIFNRFYRLSCALVFVFLLSNQAFGQYCLPTYGNDCTSGDYVDNFTFVTINNLGTACGNPGVNNYTDYRATLSTTVSMGAANTVTCAPGPTWGQYFVAFVDLNQDLDFDDAGEFFDIGYAAAGGNIVNSITIPGTATPGLTTLRVMCRFGTGPLTQADVCNPGLDYGEVEEYGLNILPPAPIDAALGAVTAPVSGCGLGATEQVMVDIFNQGTDTIFGLDVCFSVNAGIPVCETVVATILPGATYPYTFTAVVDLSVPGSYVFDANVVLLGDANGINDTLFGYTIQSIPVIMGTPYFQDFESGNGGWTSNGALNSWAFGTPTNAFIPAANSGINAWVTNLSGDYNDNELSYLVSPCMDFSGLGADPFMTFSHIFSTEACCDEGWVDISTDAGVTWNKLLSAAGTYNWYNDTGNVEWQLWKCRSMAGCRP